MIEKEIIIERCKIRYGEQRGSDDSVVYVFLHGWGSDYTIFKPLFRSVDYAIAFDFPGFGGSSPLGEPWTLATYAAVLQDFVKRKTGGREVVFIAHSFGGRVLLKMLSQQSKMPWVRQVICMGVPFTQKQKPEQKFILATLKVAKVAVRILPEPARRNLREWWCAIVGAEDYAALDNEVMKKTFQNIINTNMHKIAQSLQDYRTDFIWGTDDLAAPITDAEVVAREVGATMHRIEGGDHFPFLGGTEEAFKAIFKKIIV